MPPTYTAADIRKIRSESAPVPMHQFRTANQAAMRLIQAARVALDERITQKLRELTHLFDSHAARIEAEVASIRANKDKDAKDIAKTVLEQVTKQIRKPEDGKTPIIDYDRIVREVLPYIPPPQHGVSPDPEALVSQLEQRLPALGLAIHDALKLLPEADRPSITLFGGLEDYLKELITRHGEYSSGNAVIPVMLSGTIKNHAASALNFKGAGAPTVTVGANGVTDINFAASGGLTELVATGTINSSNQAFTFISKPTYIIIDGGKYKENSGWTWNGGPLTATVTKAPDFSIWGEA